MAASASARAVLRWLRAPRRFGSVEELERFLLTLLPEGTPSDALRVRLPLTSVAEENFRPEGLRFWTNRDPAITAALESYGRSGVPLYVYYPPTGEGKAKILPEILSVGLLISILE